MTEVKTSTVPGDLALACAHVDPNDLGDLHLIKIEGSQITAMPENAEPDGPGREIDAKWLFLCHDCYRLGMTADGDLIDAARQDFVVDRVIEATDQRSDG